MTTKPITDCVRKAFASGPCLLVLCLSTSINAQEAFPHRLPKERPDRPLSAALERTYSAYTALSQEDNELYSQFKYTELKDFDDTVPNFIKMAGLAIADDPLGPFEKHSLNPVLNSGHEVSLFPFEEGIAALVIRDGNEHFTIQFAKDGVNFEIKSITELMPISAGPYVPDAFTDTKDGRGITWAFAM